MTRPHREPASRVAWIAAVPGLGILAYILLGETDIGKKRIARMLLSTLLVFISLLQTVANTSLIRSKKSALVETTDVWSRMIYPVLLMFVLAYSFWI